MMKTLKIHKPVSKGFLSMLAENCIHTLTVPLLVQMYHSEQRDKLRNLR